MSQIMLALHDLPNPEDLLPGIRIPWWVWIGATVLLAALAQIIKERLTRRSQPSLSHNEIYLSCEAELNSCRRQLTELSLAHIATQCSLSLRNYLYLNLDEQALYETHDEFLLRSEALEQLPMGARHILGPFLSKLAQCKYEPSKASPLESEKLIKESLLVLQGLESTRKRNIA